MQQLRRHILISKLHERDVAKVDQLVDQAEVEEQLWPVWAKSGSESEQEEVASASACAAVLPFPKGRPGTATSAAKIRPTASSTVVAELAQPQPEEPVVPPPAKKTKVGTPKDPSDVCNSASVEC